MNDERPVAEQPAQDASVPPSRAELLRARRAHSVDLASRHGIGRRARAERITRALDVAITLIAAPFVTVAILIAAVAIKLDTPGPAFFSQLRTGRDGRRFRIWKLRTMVADAEARKGELADLTMAAGAAFKLADDPRITRVGRVLRKLNLDELPQLWNVLRGQMSIVGPRPTSAPTSDYDLWQTARLSTRPGLTGAWQVIPRKNEMAFDDRVRVDIPYMRSSTVGGYFRLIVRTVTHAVGRGQGM